MVGNGSIDKLPPAFSYLTVFWEAAEELLQVSVKSYIPHGFD